jgi:hypothetical protein
VRKRGFPACVYYIRIERPMADAAAAAAMPRAACLSARVHARLLAMRAALHHCLTARQCASWRWKGGLAWGLHGGKEHRCPPRNPCRCTGAAGRGGTAMPGTEGYPSVLGLGKALGPVAFAALAEDVGDLESGQTRFPANAARVREAPWSLEQTPVCAGTARPAFPSTSVCALVCWAGRAPGVCVGGGGT